ncbi:glycosyltransferase [Colwellia sp. D2M02]|uniref:glycosyltransferase n=1 Tax=Colwellia sp. D2M02 TaxID=2841562 RepID=UPI001C094D45|nr:glycosyltransferase [Colwellia sp. D2M02]MBU2894678.1 glycosyltransferase [Colwellia sp. D2M02]
MQFIVLAPNEWQSRWMNRQQLFSLIGQQHSVTYGNGALFTWHFTFGKLVNSLFSAAHTKQDNVTVVNPSYLFLRTPRVALLDKTSIEHYVAKLTKHISKEQPVVLYIFHPLFFEYVKHIKHDYLVFHAYDDYSKQSGYGSHEKENDARLSTQADLIITSSVLIQERYLKSQSENKVKFVPNGVDYDAFSNACEQPAELDNIPQPRVGYVGAINQKADLSLWLALANYFQDVSFVLIGPVNNLTQEDLHAFNQLKNLKNSFYLGSKKKEEIASYMHHFDINTMIYKSDKSGWASSGYPLKLHEYLAVGKPVISADIEAVREFSHVVSIAEGAEEWIEKIKQLLNENGQSTALAERKSVARNNTWECRVKTILNHIKSLDK